MEDIMLEKLEKFQITILAIVLALGLILSTNIITSSLPSDGITTTGSASKIVKSDNASLYLTLIARGKNKKNSYLTIQKQIPTVISYIKNNGFTDNDIELKTTNGYNTYKTLPNGNTSNEVAYYTLHQPIVIKSNDVEKIRKLSINITSLMDKNIEIESNNPEYYYSKISDLKIELLHQATTDAKQRASAMLKATHNKPGKIQSVKMGVFQITATDSTDVSDSGIYNTDSIDKKVTAVANVVFKIK